MNLAGACPECNGAGRKTEEQKNKMQKRWTAIRDEEDEDELVNADWIVVDESGEMVATVHGRTVGDCITNAELIAESPRVKQERDELIQIAQTINEYARGWKPWGGCRCDHGEDGRAQLMGEKCGRCKALDHLREISSHNAQAMASADDKTPTKETTL